MDKTKIKALAVQLEEIDEGLNRLREESAQVEVQSPEDCDLHDRMLELLSVRSKVIIELRGLGVMNFAFGVSRGTYDY